MTQQAVQLDQEHFCCSICLDLLKDPVTVPCGHHYCRRCIEKYWNDEDQKEIFSCPQCCQTFSPRPVLKKNNVLDEVVESLKKAGLQVGPSEHCYAGAGDVPCDFCTGRKEKSVKTCLQCLVSYCDTHLQPHYQSLAFKNHKLVTASTELQENICIQQKIQEREKDMKVLHQEVESINHCADRAVKDSDTIFTELNSSIERRRCGVRELIRDQQKREVNRAEEQRKHVEQEVTDLKKRLAELEKLSYTEDHIHFLHSYSSLSRISDSTYKVSDVNLSKYFDNVTVSVSKMRDELEVILKEEGTNILETVNRVDVLLSSTPEPKTRAEFLQYSCPITLDPNTVHQHLSLSKENREVTWMNKQQSYPHHRERFITFHQVLSREGLTGRCYWEVQWGGFSVDIAVSYRDISRTGINNDSRFGGNDKSWSLRCCKGYYVFNHRNIHSIIPGRVSSRVGVYLDQSAGTLSFYSISDPLTLLHSVQTTFTQTVYAGFWLGYDSTAELRVFK